MVSKAIRTSIKRKERLFKSHFLSNDPNKVKIFKTYNNKLNRIKEAAEKIILGPNLVLIVRTFKFLKKLLYLEANRYTHQQEKE